MIALAGSLELAHARLSSRHGTRADDALWRRIEHVRDCGALLDFLRGTALGHWTRGILRSSDAHAIEAILRAGWRGEVEEVARWMPDAWQDAVRWWTTWPDLAVLDHLVRGGEVLPWMKDDPLYRELAPASSGAGAAIRRDPLAGRLQALRARPGDLVAAWCDAWRRRMPDEGANAPVLLTLARELRTHMELFAAAGPGTGTPLRRALHDRLRMLFRAAILDPAAAFVYLALIALDLERLRGELVWRVAFPFALAA